MEYSEPPLYLQIAESIRRRIAASELKPGDKLPSVRDLARQWDCTSGTVNRAYALLTQEGLVVGRRGGGTHVAPNALQPEPPTWRWAALVNRAERFLLDALASGFTPTQAEAALGLAVAHWQELQLQGVPLPAPTGAPENQLRFAGSHDLALAALMRLLAEQQPAATISVEYSGSLGGLMALARGEAEVAGLHLWDAETDTYNIPFVRRVLPGRQVLLLGLARRALGLMVPAGNPQNVQTVHDLARPDGRFVNRQPGSGTRIWLDAQLKQLGIAPETIVGYERAERTHVAVAQAIAQGEATVGLGIQAAATAHGLAFIPLTHEQYELALTAAVWETPVAQALATTLRSAHFRALLLSLGGYDSALTGQERWVG